MQAAQQNLTPSRREVCQVQGQDEHLHTCKLAARPRNHHTETACVNKLYVFQITFLVTLLALLNRALLEKCKHLQFFHGE